MIPLTNTHMNNSGVGFNLSHTYIPFVVEDNYELHAIFVGRRYQYPPSFSVPETAL
jgi:hypothetical protein